MAEYVSCTRALDEIWLVNKLEKKSQRGMIFGSICMNSLIYGLIHPVSRRKRVP